MFPRVFLPLPSTLSPAFLYARIRIDSGSSFCVLAPLLPFFILVCTHANIDDQCCAPKAFYMGWKKERKIGGRRIGVRFIW